MSVARMLLPTPITVSMVSDTAPPRLQPGRFSFLAWKLLSRKSHRTVGTQITPLGLARSNTETALSSGGGSLRFYGTLRRAGSLTTFGTLPTIRLAHLHRYSP